MEIIKTIKKSKEQFTIGTKKYNDKKYLEAIESYKKVDSSDKKRYVNAQTKIVESYMDTSNSKKKFWEIKDYAIVKSKYKFKQVK
ncbi:hypothetical protein FDF31_07945 [Clostridium sporogenes]|uniref:hypothetical protein n=1 Tax=Clostridium sp. LCP25S3_F8 TaxID=3438751 RepID=UPI0013D505EF|nr:hypothetical protein [Clostridium sporogenes]NFS25567.1 hypothetical protein [Clostridium sporogenes]